MNVFAPTQPALSGNIKVTRNDWLNAALAILLSDGVENVRILSLAQKLDVSRSSFYWYFKDRQQLLDELLEHWRSTNTKAILERANRRSDTIVRGVMNVFECWADEKLFDPQLDFAIREWGRRSQPVREVVTRADEERLTAIRDMYIRHGYAEEDAFIRARVLYYMQIGYYVLGVHESFDVRLSHLSAYLRSFTGQEPTAQDIQDFSNFVMRAKSA
jgi:AcrR family transcriptional regulator